jgi:nicotinate-nucleotide adenylyltransferase
MRLGVYGGSFDPPHVAHVLLAAYALGVAAIDRLIVVPVFSHAFNKALTPFEHRVAMCELAFRDLARVEVSRIESNLPTPSRTLATIEALQQQNPGAKLSLVIGSDVLAETAKWHAFDAVSQLAPPFVVQRAEVSRSVNGAADPGLAAFYLPDVSSSRVRELFGRRGDSGATSELRSLVPTAVMDYVIEHGLYRNQT